MIYKAEAKDIETAAKLARLLWPNHTISDLKEAFSDLLTPSDAAVSLARSGNTPVGFAQCQLRHDYVEGTSRSPVGYLEGIFVAEPYRRRGYARALLAACEAWAKAMGCREFAGDCELTNEESLRFHLKAGFAEANRIICFTKTL